MKVLIAVFSCSKDIEKGFNQTIRDTWGQDLPPNVDLRFLIGTAKPGPVSEEDPAWQVDYKNYCRNKPWMATPPPALSRSLLPDELALDVPDGYMYLTHKARAAFQWAVEQDYDYVFRCDTDTFIDIPRLLASGFEKFDYTGRKLGGPKEHGYAYGGPGHFLSNKALRILMDAPITIVADDVWVGDVMRQHDIPLNDDLRYCNHWRQTPKDQIITVHLSSKSGSYENKLMWKAYSRPLPDPEIPKTADTHIEVVIQGRHMWIPRPKAKPKYSSK